MSAGVDNIERMGNANSGLVYLKVFRQGGEPFIKKEHDAAELKKKIVQAGIAVYPWRGKKRISTPGELLGAGVSGMIIDNPETCLGWIISALKHGIPVFCSRVPVWKSDQVKKIVEASRKYDCLLAFNFICRYTEGMPELREHIRRGELGKIQTFDITFRCSRNFVNKQRPDISGLYALRLHLVDLVLWLFDYPAVSDKEIPLFENIAHPKEIEGRLERILARLNLSNGPEVRISYSSTESSGAPVMDVGVVGECGVSPHGGSNDTLLSFTVDRLMLNGPAGVNCELRNPMLDEWLERLSILPRYDKTVENFLYITELLAGKVLEKEARCLNTVQKFVGHVAE